MQEIEGQEDLARSRIMVSLSRRGWWCHADAVESQSAERLSYLGDVAPPTRVPVNARDLQNFDSGCPASHTVYDAAEISLPPL